MAASSSDTEIDRLKLLTVSNQQHIFPTQTANKRTLTSWLVSNRKLKSPNTKNGTLSYWSVSNLEHTITARISQVRIIIAMFHFGKRHFSSSLNKRVSTQTVKMHNSTWSGHDQTLKTLSAMPTHMMNIRHGHMRCEGSKVSMS